jgi:hypothetical protein
MGDRVRSSVLTSATSALSKRTRSELGRATPPGEQLMIPLVALLSPRTDAGGRLLWRQRDRQLSAGENTNTIAGVVDLRSAWIFDHNAWSRYRSAAAI